MNEEKWIACIKTKRSLYSLSPPEADDLTSKKQTKQKKISQNAPDSYRDFNLYYNSAVI
jgi:hypothetical protein